MSYWVHLSGKSVDELTATCKYLSLSVPESSHQFGSAAILEADL
jgi:hypothetical protein